MDFASRIRLSTLRRDALLLLTGGVVARLCGLVFIIVLSWRLSARDIGLFSFAEALADTLIIIASFSLDSVMLRRVGARPVDEAMAQFSPLLGFRLVSGPIYLLAILIASYFAQGPTRWILPIVGVYTLLESASFCVANLFVATRQAQYRVGVEAAVECFFTLCFAGGMWLRPTIGTLLALSMMRSTLLLAGAVYFTRVRLGRFKITWDRGLLMAAVPFLGINFLNMFQGKAETLLLGWLTSFAAVGVYQLALRLLLSATFAQMAISSALFPHLAATGLDAANRRRLARGIAALTSLALLGSLVLNAQPGRIAHLLFGPGHADVVPLLRLVGLILPFRFAAMFLGSALNALSREGRVFRTLLLGTLAGVIADLALIPLYGPAGAAYGMLISAATQCLLHAVTFRNVLQEHPQPAAVGFPMAPAA